MENVDRQCPICDSDMEPDGYENNWKVFECTDDSCSGVVLKPNGDATEDEFTMEALKNMSEFDS